MATTNNMKQMWSQKNGEACVLCGFVTRWTILLKELQIWLQSNEMPSHALKAFSDNTATEFHLCTDCFKYLFNEKTEHKQHDEVGADILLSIIDCDIIYALKSQSKSYYLTRMWKRYTMKHEKYMQTHDKTAKCYQNIAQCWQYVLALTMLLKEKGLWDAAKCEPRYVPIGEPKIEAACLTCHKEVTVDANGECPMCGTVLNPT